MPTVAVRVRLQFVKWLQDLATLWLSGWSTTTLVLQQFLILYLIVFALNGIG